MERLLTIAEIMERYHFTNERTARNRMRDIGALNTRPMLVAESAVERWEAENIKRRQADEPQVSNRRRNRTKSPLMFPSPPEPTPGQLISRVRPKPNGKAG